MKIKLLFSLIFLALTPGFSTAQSPYSAAVTINGRGITYFEIDQRMMMLAVFQTAGDLEKQARKDLLEDRLREQAAQSLGITITEDELLAGMEEFASRANLDTEKFVAAIGAEGVERETFADFVKNHLLWRKVLQTRYQAKAFVSEAELDAALALGTTALSDTVLLAELVIPLTDGFEEQAQALAKDLSRRLRGYASFEEAAVTFSGAASRENGGKLDWIPLSNLPPHVATMVLALNIGEITTPIQMPNAVALFQLRGLRSNRTVSSRTISLDYASLLLPGGRSAETLAQAEVIRGHVDTCDDLRAQSDGMPEDYFTRQSLPVSKIGRNVTKELEKLDNNEISTALTQGDAGEFLMVLMLCSRASELAEGAREEVRQALFTQRLEAFGNGLLQELKGDAIIVEK